MPGKLHTLTRFTVVPRIVGCFARSPRSYLYHRDSTSTTENSYLCLLVPRVAA